MAATFPASTIPYPSSSEDSEDESSRLRLNNPPVVANRIHPPSPSPLASPALPESETHSGRNKRRKKRSPTASRRSRARSSDNIDGFSSSSDDESLVGGAGQPGLEHDTESEDLEMSDYPLTGDEGEAWAPGPDRRKRGNRRRRGLNLRGGDGGVGLGDRLVMADGERPVISDEEKKIADGKVLRDMAINALFIGLW